MKHLRLILLLLSVTVPASAEIRVTHGVASGEVTSTSAVLWARASVAGAELVADVATDGETRTVRAASRDDGTAQVHVDGLRPATLYNYRLHFENGGERSDQVDGTFRTAPRADQTAPVRFVVGGDVGGQSYCRHVDGGYRIFNAMAAFEPHFFVANGDMIYADNTCPANGPGDWKNVPGDFPNIDAPHVDWTDAALVREIIDAHWRYNRADPAFAEFLRRVPIYAQWDDHEVINDFGAAWASWTKTPFRDGFRNLVTAGRDAVFAWNPMHRAGDGVDDPHRIYGRFRWGRDVELFLLDARSYRSLNDLTERPENSKTMLSQPQLDWLVEGLKASNATWKIVSSDVPLSVPTGSSADLYGRDGFADGNKAPWEPQGFATRTGFEDELGRLLRALDAADVKNVVFVATDVHFAMNLRYEIDVDGDGDPLLFHELLNGPLNAGCSRPPELDPTFNPIILYGEGDLMNFSAIEVTRREDGTPVLRASIRDVDGNVRFGSALELVAE